LILRSTFFAGSSRCGALLRECPPAAGAASSFISLRRAPHRDEPNDEQAHQRFAHQSCCVSGVADAAK